MMKKSASSTTLVTSVLGLAALGLVPAAANDADVIKTGSCSQAATWKLKAGPNNGLIEVEGEVDSNVVGQTWHWRIRHNGALEELGTSVTVAPSGSFEVRRLLTDAAGADTIGWRATNPATDEICRGSLKF